MIRRQALLVLTLVLCLAAPAAAEVRVPEGQLLSDAIAGSLPGDTATAGVDYTQEGLDVQTVDDAVHEADETFRATVNGLPDTVVIVDNDTPAIEVLAASAPENAGVATVTLRAATTLRRPIDVAYSTATGTADASDFDGSPGTARFAAGTTETTISIPLAGDADDEEDETFTVQAAGSQATVTIANDDLRALSIGDAVATEGDGANTVVRLPVTLDAPTFRTVTVTFGTQDGTALGQRDFLARLGNVTIPAGQRTATIEIAVVSDEAREDPEAFGVLIGRPQGATVARGVAVATITDDDAAPVLDSRLVPLKMTAPRLRAGRVAVRVTCPKAETSCKGRLRLYTERDRRARSRLLRTERRVGSASYTLKGGRSRTLSIRLPAGTRAAARRAGRLLVRAYAVTTDAAGNVDSDQRRATLRFRR